MNNQDFFMVPANPAQKQYEALRAFYVEKRPAIEIAVQFGYTLSALYSLTRDFNKYLQRGDTQKRFFVVQKPGRKSNAESDEMRRLIIILRKKYLSVCDIKSILDTQDFSISERQINNILRAEGFARLPRRSREDKQVLSKQTPVLASNQSALLSEDYESFQSSHIGILCFLPIIRAYGIDTILNSCNYPGTKVVPTTQSILSFLALKLSSIKRYTTDDLWCMDRGLGLFAGMNVLPKAAWFSSYSHRVTRKMNLDFLKRLNNLWVEYGLLSDTANLDFCTIPYWGDDAALEKNWSGTRHHALNSILAAIAHDPASGIITYGDTNVRQESEAKVVVEFLDFYKQSSDELRYLVFDSKFTTYENLSKLDDDGVKFITIRRRGKSIIDELSALPKSAWKKVRVLAGNGKKRALNVHEQVVFLKSYNKKIRQIAITGNGRIKPAMLITNDFDLSQEDIIRKYSRRWLVEKTISEQTHFFHLNKVSSSMVIKVDFDLTMTILAYNLYRLLANGLPGHHHRTAQTLFEKFIDNSGYVVRNEYGITVSLKKKRNLPAILSFMQEIGTVSLPWLHHQNLSIAGATTT